MIKTFIHLFLAIGFWIPTAQSKNSLFVNSYNEFTKNRKCQKVSKNELAQIIPKCQLDKPRSSFESNYDVFESAVFNESARKQIIKNNCMIEQAKDLLDNHIKFAEWKNELLSSWLRWKKSKLILEKCITLNKQIGRNGKISSYSFPGYRGPPLEKDKELINICVNSIDQVKQYDAIFSATIPYLSGPNYFEVIDEHRNVFINPQTGKPLSNNDLLYMNLRDLEKVNINLNDKESVLISNALKQEVSLKGVERQKSNSELEKNKDQNNNFFPDEESKDFLFKQGTVQETLYQYDISPIQKASNASKCLLNKYEENASGELLEFFLTSLISGGIIFKTIKYLPTKFFKNGLSINQGLNYGVYATGGLALISKEFPKCISSYNNVAKPYSANQILNSKADGETAMPDQIGFKDFSAETETPVSPNCQQLGDSTLAFLNTKERYCLRAAISSLLLPLPAKYTLPGMAIAPNETEPK
jgi:hypothetical protein